MNERHEKNDEGLALYNPKYYDFFYEIATRKSKGPISWQNERKRLKNKYPEWAQVDDKDNIISTANLERCAKYILNPTSTKLHLKNGKYYSYLKKIAAEVETINNSQWHNIIEAFKKEFPEWKDRPIPTSKMEKAIKEVDSYKKRKTPVKKIKDSIPMEIEHEEKELPPMHVYTSNDLSSPSDSNSAGKNDFLSDSNEQNSSSSIDFFKANFFQHPNLSRQGRSFNPSEQDKNARYDNTELKQNLDLNKQISFYQNRIDLKFKELEGLLDEMDSLPTLEQKDKNELVLKMEELKERNKTQPTARPDKLLKLIKLLDALMMDIKDKLNPNNRYEQKPQLEKALLMKKSNTSEEQPKSLKLKPSIFRNNQFNEYNPTSSVEMIEEMDDLTFRTLKKTKTSSSAMGT